ncbi:MAG: thiamine phosphate synthase [Spirochaetia bacterium]|nr:thiamine phosphate synthase [Spirochaetia bacterium]
MTSAFPGRSRATVGSGLYPILDDDSCRKARAEALDLLSLWASLGLTYFQWRAKSLSAGEYVTRARGFKECFPRMDIIANDHWQAAVENPQIFSGLHLGQEDFLGLPESGAALLKGLPQTGSGGTTFALGLSTHNEHEQETARTAKARGFSWTYLAAGPCFQTKSKPLKDPVLTTADRRRLIEKAAEIAPRVCLIGGISSSNVGEVLADFTGAGLWRERAGVAVIGSAMTRDEVLSLQQSLRMLD